MKPLTYTVQPAPGRRVRQPHLPGSPVMAAAPEATVVPRDPFYRARLRDGDLTLIATTAPSTESA